LGTIKASSSSHLRLQSAAAQAPRRMVRIGITTLQPVEENLAEQKRRQVVDRPGQFDAVLRQLPCSVHRADIVDEYIQLWLAGQHLGGQSAHRGLRREVGDESRHRRFPPRRRPDASRRNPRPGLTPTDDREASAERGERSAGDCSQMTISAPCARHSRPFNCRCLAGDSGNSIPLKVQNGSTKNSGGCLCAGCYGHAGFGEIRSLVFTTEKGSMTSPAPAAMRSRLFTIVASKAYIDLGRAD
jgi:hypothetical protein